MANQKTGLEYFALDTDIELDDKIALIEAKHGAVGFTVVIKLFLKIYGDKGYYYDWNEQSALIFSRRSNINYEIINDVVKDAIGFDLFDKKMYEKHKILTSKRIQEHYLEATKRRKIVEFYKPYLLLNGQNVDIKRENVCILAENDDILKQSKVKESKVKESKEDNIVAPYQQIKDLFNDICKSLPSIAVLSDTRKNQIRLRWGKFKKIELWKDLFERTEESEFLSGRSGKWANCSFDWLVKETNMIKVLEGNYDNDRSKTTKYANRA